MNITWHTSTTRGVPFISCDTHLPRGILPAYHVTRIYPEGSSLHIMWHASTPRDPSCISCDTHLPRGILPAYHVTRIYPEGSSLHIMWQAFTPRDPSCISCDTHLPQGMLPAFHVTRIYPEGCSQHIMWHAFTPRDAPGHFHLRSTWCAINILDKVEHFDMFHKEDRQPVPTHDMVTNRCELDRIHLTAIHIKVECVCVFSKMVATVHRSRVESGGWCGGGGGCSPRW